MPELECSFVLEAWAPRVLMAALDLDVWSPILSPAAHIYTNRCKARIRRAIYRELANMPMVMTLLANLASSLLEESSDPLPRGRGGSGGPGVGHGSHRSRRQLRPGELHRQDRPHPQLIHLLTHHEEIKIAQKNLCHLDQGLSPVSEQ